MPQLLFDVVRLVVELNESAGANGRGGPHLEARKAVKVRKGPQDGADAPVDINLRTVPGQQGLVRGRGIRRQIREQERDAVPVSGSGAASDRPRAPFTARVIFSEIEKPGKMSREAWRVSSR